MGWQGGKPMKTETIVKIKNIGGVIAFMPFGVIGRYVLNSPRATLIGLGIQLVGIVVLWWGHRNDPNSVPVRWPGGCGISTCPTPKGEKCEE